MSYGSIKRDLASGRTLVATNLTVADPFLVEAIGSAGFDFAIIDMQHAPLTLENVQAMLVSLTAVDCPAIVRAPANEPAIIGQVLDIGADGLVVPMIDSADDVRAAVSAAKYPPNGRRSWGPRRAIRRAGSASEYETKASNEIAIIAQIETSGALDNLGAILSVQGLDAIMIGPADLAQSLGLTVGTDDAAFEAAINKVFAACTAAQRPFGYFTGTAEMARHWAERGALITTIASDVSLMLDGAARALTTYRTTKQGARDFAR